MIRIKISYITNRKYTYKYSNQYRYRTLCDVQEEDDYIPYDKSVIWSDECRSQNYEKRRQSNTKIPIKPKSNRHSLPQT